MYHPVVNKIEDLLVQRSFWFEKFEHEPVRTSSEAANVRTGYGLTQGAKALIVEYKNNGKSSFAMVVIPGDKKFDSKKVKAQLSTKDLSFASIEDVSKVTGGVQVGGVPPFGNLFNIPVIADKNFLGMEKIIFNAGDRSVSIAMKFSDYLDLVKPTLADIIA